MTRKRKRERESLDKTLFHRRNLLIKSRNLSRQRLMSTFYSGAARALEHDEIDYAGAGRSFATSWWISYAGKQDFCTGITFSLSFSLYIYIVSLYFFIFFCQCWGGWFCCVGIGGFEIRNLIIFILKWFFRSFVIF